MSLLYLLNTEPWWLFCIAAPTIKSKTVLKMFIRLSKLGVHLGLLKICKVLMEIHLKICRALMDIQSTCENSLKDMQSPYRYMEYL